MADVILANPPFMSPKGGIKPHKRFSVQASRSEVLFVDYMAEHLTATGRAAIVVPEGIIFQSGTAYQALRKMLVDTSLVAVVSLPAGVFNPYSGVKTSILILDKRLHKQLDSVLFVKVGNDGFNLGAQRRAVVDSHLPEATRLLRTWMTAPQGFEGDGAMARAVTRAKIGANGDFNLSGERYVATSIGASNLHTLVPIGELCELFNGRPFKPEQWEGQDSGGLPIIRIQNLNNPESSFNYFTGEVAEKNLISNGDLLFSWSGSRGSSFGAHIWRGPHAVLNQHIFKVLVDEKRVYKNYMHHALNRAVGEIEENLHGGVGLVHITKGNLERIRVPLPPLEVQHQIVAEIEGYQKVIDGAQLVLESYQPHIVVDSNWPRIALEVVCDLITDGTHFSPESTAAGDFKYVTAKNIKRNGLDFKNLTYVTLAVHKEIYARCPVKRGDVLYIKDGATAGIATINSLDEEFSLLSSVAVLRGNRERLENRFLAHFLNTDLGREQMLSMVSGVAITRLTLIKIKSATIPLPDLETQRTIVAEIEAEQALVASNRELIRRMEAKVKAAIDRVWGSTSDN